MVTSFDIFVGGPMGDSADDGAGVPFGDHIGNICAAIETLRPELEAESTEWRIEVHNPEVKELGLISSTVFRMISYAELGILDLSKNSPSVMYELTLMHALGIPTLPVMLRGQHDPADLPFYLTQQYCVFVENFRVETLVEALRPNLRSFLTGTIFALKASNPLTDHFGVPLVDASATTGLATGYYHNFLQHVIRETNSIFTMLDGLKQIVILKPATLDEVAGMRDPLLRRIGELGLAVDGVDPKDGQIYPDPNQIRGKLLIFRAGNYIFDFPAPLSAQKSSPLHTRLARLLTGVTGPGEEAIRQLLQRQQKAMIDGWFAALTRLCQSPNSNPNLVVYKTPDEFVELLRTEMR
jgi:hypothetical protein